MSGEFVARMEDVLYLYHEDYDPDHPVVCFDETSRQLVADKRPAIGAKPGRVERYDYEYKRNGTRNLFMFCEPKAGWRHVEVTEQRTAVDFAHQMRWLVDEAYPHTETIRLVLDNLNTHKLGSLYDAFEPADARRIAKRLELHYTPVHGSWLNMAEIELSVFSNQCLNRRISDEVVLKREVSALEHERNQAAAVIDWRFSTQNARTKLQHIYPSYSDCNGTSKRQKLDNLKKRGVDVVEVTVRTEKDLRHLCWVPVKPVWAVNTRTRMNDPIPPALINKEADNRIVKLIRDLTQCSPALRRQFLDVCSQLHSLDSLSPIRSDNPLKDELAKSDVD